MSDLTKLAKDAADAISNLVGSTTGNDQPAASSDQPAAASDLVPPTASEGDPRGENTRDDPEATTAEQPKSDPVCGDGGEQSEPNVKDNNEGDDDAEGLPHTPAAPSTPANQESPTDPSPRARDPLDAAHVPPSEMHEAHGGRGSTDHSRRHGSNSSVKDRLRDYGGGHE